MEIKIGDYVRTKKGNIGKVLDVTTCTGQKRKKYLIKWNIDKAYYITGTTIVKHSPYIIDLIEIGDFVNMCEVVEVRYTYQGEKFANFVNVDTDEVSYGWGIGVIPEKEIKTIVTHEQFAGMEYKV